MYTVHRLGHFTSVKPIVNYRASSLLWCWPFLSVGNCFWLFTHPLSHCHVPHIRIAYFYTNRSECISWHESTRVLEQSPFQMPSIECPLIRRLYFAIYLSGNGMIVQKTVSAIFAKYINNRQNKGKYVRVQTKQKAPGRLLLFWPAIFRRYVWWLLLSFCSCATNVNEYNPLFCSFQMYSDT